MQNHMNAKNQNTMTATDQDLSIPKSMNHGRIVSTPDEDQCLDSAQLNRLEQSFREWANGSPREDVRLSRRRILIVFLLIRYTGAKLNEVLAINPFEDIHTDRQSVLFRSAGPESNTEIGRASCRERV